MGNKYKCTIVGCGDMGAVNMNRKFPYIYSHIGAIISDPQTELIAVADADKTRAEYAGTKLGVKSYINWRQMIEKVNPDIVFCSAGPEVNPDVIRTAFNRKIKGVYCEKPLSLSLATADELAELEEKNPQTSVQVGYLRNSDIAHNNIARFVKEGGLGNLQGVRIIYNGGAFSILPHATAYLEQVLDGAKSVSGRLSPRGSLNDLDPNIDGDITYNFSLQGRNITTQVLATERGKKANNLYLFEMEFMGDEKILTIAQNGWGFLLREISPSHIFWDAVGTKHAYPVAFASVRGGKIVKELSHNPKAIPKELYGDKAGEMVANGLENLLFSMATAVPTNCTIDRARRAEEVAHALNISATSRNKGRIIKLPLHGEDRKHSFGKNHV